MDAEFNACVWQPFKKYPACICDACRMNGRAGYSPARTGLINWFGQMRSYFPFICQNITAFYIFAVKIKAFIAFSKPIFKPTIAKPLNVR
jgi:hypothetical protein